jgi:hypothetical protein
MQKLARSANRAVLQSRCRYREGGNVLPFSIQPLNNQFSSPFDLVRGREPADRKANRPEGDIRIDPHRLEDMGHGGGARVAGRAG